MLSKNAAFTSITFSPDRSGNLQPVEYNILSQWYDMFDQMPEFDIGTDLTGEFDTYYGKL